MTFPLLHVIDDGTNVIDDEAPLTLTEAVALAHNIEVYDEVTAEDAIPTELKKMRVISSVGGTVLDATTGYATQNTGRTSDITVPADSVGKQGVCFTAYLFLPEEQINTNYTVQALGQNDVVLYEKHFNNVPLRINYLTVWQGKVFETSSSNEEEYEAGIRLYWDTQWADTLIISQ